MSRTTRRCPESPATGLLRWWIRRDRSRLRIRLGRRPRNRLGRFHHCPGGNPPHRTQIRDRIRSSDGSNPNRRRSRPRKRLPRRPRPPVPTRSAASFRISVLRPSVVSTTPQTSVSRRVVRSSLSVVTSRSSHRRSGPRRCTCPRCAPERNRRRGRPTRPPSTYRSVHRPVQPRRIHPDTGTAIRRKTRDRPACPPARRGGRLPGPVPAREDRRGSVRSGSYRRSPVWRPRRCWRP
jgi:hypothetical protein